MKIIIDKLPIISRIIANKDDSASKLGEPIPKVGKCFFCCALAMK